MSSLKTLIQITRNQLDGLLIKLTNLEISQQRLQLDLTNLEEQITQEIDFCAASPAVGNSLETFLKRADRRCALTAASLRELEQETLNIQEKIRDEFQELKKFELAQEELEKNKRAEENYKIQQDLDEQAILQYQRIQH